jgi:hypothetical protein
MDTEPLAFTSSSENSLVSPSISSCKGGVQGGAGSWVCGRAGAKVWGQGDLRVAGKQTRRSAGCFPAQQGHAATGQRGSRLRLHAGARPHTWLSLCVVGCSAMSSAMMRSTSCFRWP